jgi:gentisate 1,2-dioxygenase
MFSFNVVMSLEKRWSVNLHFFFVIEGSRFTVIEGSRFTVIEGSRFTVIEGSRFTVIEGSRFTYVICIYLCINDPQNSTHTTQKTES